MARTEFLLRVVAVLALVAAIAVFFVPDGVTDYLIAVVILAVALNATSSAMSEFRHGRRQMGLMWTGGAILPTLGAVSLGFHASKVIIICYFAVVLAFLAFVWWTLEREAQEMRRGHAEFEAHIRGEPPT